MHCQLPPPTFRESTWKRKSRTRHQAKENASQTAELRTASPSRAANYLVVYLNDSLTGVSKYQRSDASGCQRPRLLARPRGRSQPHPCGHGRGMGWPCRGLLPGPPFLLGRIVRLGFRVHFSLVSVSPSLSRLVIDRSLPPCSRPPGVSARTAGLHGFIFCPLDESYGTVTPRRQMTMIPPFESGLNT